MNRITTADLLIELGGREIDVALCAIESSQVQDAGDVQLIVLGPAAYEGEEEK